MPNLVWVGSSCPPFPRLDVLIEVSLQNPQAHIRTHRNEVQGYGTPTSPVLILLKIGRCAGGSLVYVRRNFPLVSFKLNRLFYETLLCSKLMYGPCICHFYCVQLTDSLEAIQRHQVRLITFKYYAFSCFLLRKIILSLSHTGALRGFVTPALKCSRDTMWAV